MPLLASAKFKEKKKKKALAELQWAWLLRTWANQIIPAKPF